MVGDTAEPGKPCIHDEHWSCLPQQRGAVQFHDRLKEIGALHDRKQLDYGRPNDPFANIRASTAWGVPGWVGALIRAGDKLARLQKAASGATLCNESVRDSLLDLATYAVIALTMFDEAACLPGKPETHDVGPAEAALTASKWLPWRSSCAESAGSGGGERSIPPPVKWWDDA